MSTPMSFARCAQNGAIIAHATESRYLAPADFQLDSDDALIAALREAVHACCAEDAFERAADEMSSSIQSDFDPALMLMPVLSRLPPKIADEVLQTILGRFFEGGDVSQFGFMNAVTSVARDTRDPGNALGSRGNRRWHPGQTPGPRARTHHGLAGSS